MNLILICILLVSFFYTTAQELWQAQAYAQQTLQDDRLESIILKHLAIKPTDTILDIGCGPGHTTAHLASIANQGTIIGIDSCQSMIIYAQNEYSNLPNLMFIQHDANKLCSLLHATYNYIISISCLHWIQDIEPVLKDIYHLLKPQGAFTAALAEKNQFLYQPIIKTATSQKWRNYFKNSAMQPWYPHDQQSMSKLLISTGFNNALVYIWHRQENFINRQAFYTSITSWINAIAHIQELSPEKRTDFVNDVIDLFLLSINHTSGIISFLNPILIIHAQK